MVADGVEDAAANNGRDELLNEEGQEDAANGSQVEVVDEEEGLELEGLAGAHVLASTKDDGVVDDDEDGGRLEGRHGGLKRHKLEVVGRVADDGSPCLVEDGPQVDAKGAIDRGHRDLFEERSHFGECWFCAAEETGETEGRLSLFDIGRIDGRQESRYSAA